MNAAMKPLGRLIAKAALEHADTIVDAKGDKVVNEAKEKVITKKIEQLVKGGVIDLDELKRLKDELKAQQTGSKEDEPVLRRYKTNDPTVEKLGELLRENPGGLLYMRDELVGLIASWDKSGREGDRQFFHKTEKMKITKEIAEAFGYRDRCLGVDAESRNITLDRFRGRSRVTRAYWDGWAEADHYVDNHWRWGIEAGERGKCHIRIDGYPYPILLRCSKTR